MKRMRFSGMDRRWGIGTLLLIGFLIFALAGCESIFGPSSESSSSDSDDEEARIIVTNNYDETLDIYMDGVLQFTLADDESDKIRDVTLDEHELEAKRAGTSTVVDDETFDVTSYTDYAWTIDDAPDIDVINNYGVALKIFMDGNYQFEIVNEEDRWIMNVSFGEHFLKAVKASDDREVASTTLNIEYNKDYAWTIQ
ncbi:MAG: hypothetical protein H6P98_191 [Candidatus Aminicenantes bacterium]|nr:hypothetical protein [Candidatus Aminicenantes bacterium]